MNTGEARQPTAASGGAGPGAGAGRRTRSRSGWGPGHWLVPLAVLVGVATACGSGPGTEQGSGQDGGPADSAVVDSPVAEVPSDTTPGDSVTPGTWVYACPTGFAFAARIDRDSATVELVNRDVTLPRMPTASGARYGAGDVVFWSQGSEGMLEAGGTAHRGCRAIEATTPWEKARLLGIAFRALGQEPGWIVDVNPDDWIRYIGDYGQTRRVFPPVAPDGDSTALTYRTATDGHTLMVEFRRTPCHDAMSGRPFAYTVMLEVDGRELQGCGRRLRQP